MKQPMIFVIFSSSTLFGGWRGGASDVDIQIRFRFILGVEYLIQKLFLI